MINYIIIFVRYFLDFLYLEKSKVNNSQCLILKYFNYINVPYIIMYIR